MVDISRRLPGGTNHYTLTRLIIYPRILGRGPGTQPGGGSRRLSNYWIPSERPDCREEAAKGIGGRLNARSTGAMRATSYYESADRVSLFRLCLDPFEPVCPDLKLSVDLLNEDTRRTEVSSQQGEAVGSAVRARRDSNSQPSVRRGPYRAVLVVSYSLTPQRKFLWPVPVISGRFAPFCVGKVW
jgi:hypothetical protein